MTEAKSEKPASPLLARMKSRQEMNSPTAPKPIKKVEPVAEQPKPKKVKQPTTQKPPVTYEGDMKRCADARVEAIKAAQNVIVDHSNVPEVLIEANLLANARYMSLRDLIQFRWNADGTPKPVAELK